MHAGSGYRSYRRTMVSFLNRNLEKGTRDVCEMLGERSTGSLGDIGRIRRERPGEEAGMKLLFPMMLVICTDSGYVVIPGSAELFFIAGC